MFVCLFFLYLFAIISFSTKMANRSIFLYQHLCMFTVYHIKSNMEIVLFAFLGLITQTVTTPPVEIKTPIMFYLQFTLILIK